MPEAPVPLLRVDTDLVFTDGSKLKLALNSQRPVIRLIVQASFDKFRASLLLQDAFPTPTVAVTFAKEALIIAAEKQHAGLVRRRIEADDEYALRLSTLVGLMTLEMTSLTLIDSRVHECHFIAVTSRSAAV